MHCLHSGGAFLISAFACWKQLISAIKLIPSSPAAAPQAATVVANASAHAAAALKPQNLAETTEERATRTKALVNCMIGGMYSTGILGTWPLVRVIDEFRTLNVGIRINVTKQVGYLYMTGSVVVASQIRKQTV